MADNNKELVLAGKISSPHGIKGLVKVFSYLDSPENFGSYKNYFDVEGKKIKLKYHFSKKNFAIIEINEVRDRNSAEKEREKEIFIDKKDLPQTEKNEFYHNDLIGLKVLDYKTGIEIGHIIAIHNFGAGDIIEIETNDEKCEMFSFDEKTFPKIEVKKSAIYLNRPKTINT